MLNEIKLLATCFFSFIIIDLLWIGVIAKKFYIIQLMSIGRINNEGQLQPVLWAAVVVYILLSVGVVYYVLPRIEFEATPTFLAGALMGLIIYGVYDMTNYSTLKDYSLWLTIGDMIWGAILCGIVTSIARSVRDLVLTKM